MRKLLFVFAIGSMILSAQPPAGKGAPHKNLQVLSEADMSAGAMRQATAGLGVMCTFCHVDDRSSDEKPTKLMARKMFAMTKEINAKFPDGKVHVTCYTCHRGAEEPLTAPPAAQ
jgi:Photosynthetic reaction centre cytochrome C subunit